MSRITFVALDTNILFRVITQGQPGCELESLQQLKALVDDKRVSLLVPEVTLLELEKLYRSLENDITGGCERIRGNLAAKQARETVWNELHDAIPFLENQLSQWKHKKIEDAKCRHDEVQKLLESGVKLSFDQEIMYRAKRRILAGRYADPNGKPEADCFILESLIESLASKEATRP